MSALLEPGDARAGDLFSDAAVVLAMVAVEQAWLEALVAAGMAPAAAAADLPALLLAEDTVRLAEGAERGGNPVIPLVGLLRERAGTDDTARWLHQGLTSQDVLDTALVLCARDVLERVASELRAQTAALTDLAERYRRSVMAGRTLTQHAVPTTFGLKATTWLHGVLDAAEGVGAVAVRLPAQFGGAAGTMAAVAELARLSGDNDPSRAAVELSGRAAATLGLHAVAPWHTARATVTRVGDALVGCTDAWGRIANDVLTLARPEIGELAEPASEGRGGSSTMPQKVNPVLSGLVRRAALTAPTLAAQLHLAAADSGDERAAGAWHAEWPVLQQLGRRAVAAASQVSELLGGLRVDAARMRATAEASAPDLLAERRALAGLAVRPTGPSPATLSADARDGHLGSYLGAVDLLVDAALERAAAWRKVAR